MHPSRIFLQIVFFASSSLKSCLHTGFFKIISVEKWAKVCPQMVLFSSALAKCWSKLEHLRPCGVGGCSGQDVMQGGSLQCTAGLDQEGIGAQAGSWGKRHKWAVLCATELSVLSHCVLKAVWKGKYLAHGFFLVIPMIYCWKMLSQCVLTF